MTRATETHREQAQSTGIRLAATCVSSLPASLLLLTLYEETTWRDRSIHNNFHNLYSSLVFSSACDSFRKDKRNRKDNISNFRSSGLLASHNSSRVTYARGCTWEVTYRVAQLPSLAAAADEETEDEQQFPFSLCQSLPSSYLSSPLHLCVIAFAMFVCLLVISLLHRMRREKEELNQLFTQWQWSVAR